MQKLSFIRAAGSAIFLSVALFASAQTVETKPAYKLQEGVNDFGGTHSEMQIELAPIVSYPLLMPQLSISGPQEFFRCEGDEEENPELERLREEMDEMRELEAAKLGNNYLNPFDQTVDATTPTLVSSFNATSIGSGYPPDNTMAISNGGYIVVAVNSSIAIYNTSGTLLGSWSLYSFFNGAGGGYENDFYDPNVLYDSGSDRFFFSCCVGRTYQKSKVLCAFSQSNNPLNGWNNYYLTGNPLGNNCWLDFPRIAYSTNEVYVSGNLFTNAGSYNQSIFYHMTKQKGYSGQNLTWQYWYNISGSPFSLLPVSYGGSGSYGPGVYLVATSSSSGSAVKFYNLTDDLTASNEQLKYYSVSVPSYSVGANAVQKGSSTKLSPGDCRAQNGFYQNGLVHFVYGAATNGSYNGVKYHRINVSNQTSSLNKSIYSSGYDLCFPGIAWAGTSSSDKGVLISFQHTSSNSFPGVGAFNVDDAGAVSSWTGCATGAGYVKIDFPSASLSRWGDYTLLQKRQNSSPRRYWGSASFGNTSHNYTAKVFELRIGTSFHEDDLERDGIDKTVEGIHVFPNPAVHGSFQVGVQMAKEGQAEISLFDTQGKLVRALHNGLLPEGLNNLSVQTDGLPIGVYFVRVSDHQTIVAYEKIVVAY